MAAMAKKYILFQLQGFTCQFIIKWSQNTEAAYEKLSPHFLLNNMNSEHNPSIYKLLNHGVCLIFHL